jgi:hypothetical protein
MIVEFNLAPCAYGPFIKKHISKCQKNPHVYLHNLCVFMKFFKKSTFYLIDVKEIKHLS